MDTNQQNLEDGAVSLNGKRPTSILRQQASKANGTKSKGPVTEIGKANSRKNATKHGLLSSVVLLEEVEPRRELDVLLKRLHDDLKPEGMMEEFLVDEIAVCCWRLRRALQSESGHVQTNMLRKTADLTAKTTKLASDMRCLASFSRVPDTAEVERMSEFPANSRGFRAVQNHVRELLINKPFGDDPEFTRLAENAIKTLDLAAELLADLESRETTHHVHSLCLPSATESDTILRYETTIKRQLFRAMDQLERLQRRRKGEYVPPPVKVGIQKED